MTHLIIVESPTKAREISHFLGRDYKVLASMGHVRDLPTSSMGISPPDFVPEYQPTEKGRGVLAELRRAAKEADTIFLASDPDREGEAIAWHISDALNLPKKKTRRITYTEITETAVKYALSHPRDIDMQRVAAQEARRVADRIIGYGVSPALCQAGNARLSAGRTQTPALGILVEREAEIRAHKVTYHYSASLDLDSGTADPIQVDWNRRPYLPKGDEYILDKALAEAAARPESVVVTDTSIREKSTPPAAPFSTSAFQQACSTRLNLSPDVAMRIAQTLFETGRITYMRTDSTNLSEEAIADIRQYAGARGLPLPRTPNMFHTRTRNAQEAHEAIRPTHMNDEGQNLAGDAGRVYQLIHRQALVCQLAPLVERVSATRFSGTDAKTRNTFEYKASGYRTVSPGFTVVTGQPDKVPLLECAAGDVFDVIDGRVQSLETKPRPRFTEASFLAELERLGIGRPSTFSSILSTLYFRRYSETRGKSLVPTPVGQAVFGALKQTRFAQVRYTADMEETLDKIAEGKAGYLDCVRPIYAESQRDAGSIRPFSLPASAKTATPATKRRRTTGDNPATKSTGTRTRRVKPAAPRTPARKTARRSPRK